MFSLDIEGEGINDVIFQDRQIDPVTGRLIHADLRRFAKGEKIEMTVPIHLTGEPDALKEEGAVLVAGYARDQGALRTGEHAGFDRRRYLRADGGHAIHVSDLKVGEGIEIHEAPETVVASIVIVKEAVLEPQIEEGGRA